MKLYYTIVRSFCLASNFGLGFYLALQNNRTLTLCSAFVTASTIAALYMASINREKAVQQIASEVMASHADLLCKLDD